MMKLQHQLPKTTDHAVQPPSGGLSLSVELVMLRSIRPTGADKRSLIYEQILEQVTPQYPGLQIIAANSGR